MAADERVQGNASRSEGVWLGTLPGLEVLGGPTGDDCKHNKVRDVWRLDPAMMRWEPVPLLLTAPVHACCAVRGSIVALGGVTSEGGVNRDSSAVETLSEERRAFVDPPPLSRGGVCAADESDSAAGHVLLAAGFARRSDGGIASEVHLVDLANGTRTRMAGMVRALS